MKEAVKNVVSDLNGESIEGMSLRQKIADEYKLLISKTGNKAEIDSANQRLNDLESIKPFLKLMRNYGYNSRQATGGSVGQAGLFNPIMDDTIWEKSINKAWNALSRSPPVSQARNMDWQNKLREKQAEARNKYYQLLRELATNPLTPQKLKESSTLAHELYQHGERLLAERLKEKIRKLGGKL